ncbi:MAG: hypothetical protein NTU41_10360 [Chloroflexi bacterium]|nr:hypothetical protein [Chloroflexota bacterium]
MTGPTMLALNAKITEGGIKEDVLLYRCVALAAELLRPADAHPPVSPQLPEELPEQRAFSLSLVIQLGLQLRGDLLPKIGIDVVLKSFLLRCQLEIHS